MLPDVNLKSPPLAPPRTSKMTSDACSGSTTRRDESGRVSLTSACCGASAKRLDIVGVGELIRLGGPTGLGRVERPPGLGRLLMVRRWPSLSSTTRYGRCV